MLNRVSFTGNKVLLDTDVLSHIFSKRDPAQFFLPYLQGHTVFVSFINVAEIYHGAYKNSWGNGRLKLLESFLSRYGILPYNHQLCLKWAQTISDCERAGHPIEDSDCWIAACALHYDCALATVNARHFQHVHGLKIISPAVI